MIALKFEVRAKANGTNMFVEQETATEVSLNERASIDKACMIGMGSFSTPREMMIASEALVKRLVSIRSEHKFEEVYQSPLMSGSCRILAKLV